MSAVSAGSPDGATGTHPHGRRTTLVGDGLLALALSGVLGVPTVWLLSTPGTEPTLDAAPATGSPWLAVAVAATVGAHLAVGVRRLAPRISFAVVMTCAAVLTVLSVWWFLPSTLLVLVSVYSVCAHGRRGAPLVAALVLVVGTPATVVAGFLVAGLPGGPAEWVVHSTVRLGPWPVAAWAWGMFRRTRIAYVAALEDRAVRAERERESRARVAMLEERTRIAREMHDVVGHALSVMVSQADGGRYAVRTQPGLGEEVLTTIATTGREALADVRGLLAVLSDPEPDASSAPVMADIEILVDRVVAAGLPVEFVGVDLLQDHRLTRSCEAVAVRVVQEALTNVLKHAGDGATAWLTVMDDGRHLTVSVEDDGAGDDQEPVRDGTGILGMRERVTTAGGHLSAAPRPGGGFVVTARLPHREERQ